MMYWRFFKAFPKWAVAAGIVIASTALFMGWWLLRGSLAPPPQMVAVKPQPTAVAENKREEAKKIAASLPARLGWLALVGSDLYDISTGERLFPNWLSGIPQRMFYQPDTNKLMVQVERGVIRYGLDGKRDAAMGETSPPAFTHDGKQAIFVRDGDVWLADVDWKAFSYVNERQATKLGQFNAPFFAANVMLGSAKSIVVRNMNQLVRVNLLMGDVQPINLPMNDLIKRRSPDGRFLVGDEPRNIYAFDVEAADAHNMPTNSRDRVVDWQWLDNERCAFIVGGMGVGLYDRSKNAIEEVCALPFPCNKMAGPSPDGRFVLCAARQGIVVVDTEKKTAQNFGTPAQHFGWVGNDTLIYARDVPDTSIRGTWLKKMSEDEQQVMADPYTVGRDGSGAVAPMLDVGLVVFGTRDALYRMKPDGTELREIAKLNQPVGRIQAVEIWGE